MRTRLAFVMCGAALSAWAQPPAPGRLRDPLPPKCVAAAKARAIEGAAGERAYQIALAQCGGATPDEAHLTGTINAEFFGLALKLSNAELTPSGYAARVRDRERKWEVATKRPGWLVALRKGDRDGDLVPDDRDRCPDTPELEPTGEDGCPLKEPPPPSGASPEDIDKLRDSLGVMVSPDCDGSPAPDVSEPVRAVYVENGSALDLTVTRATNQSPKCLVFYEINVRLTRPALAAGPLPFITDVRYVTVVFRETEAVSKGARHVVFRVSNAGASAHQELWEMFDIYRGRQVRVRALNGNGESGGWSAVRIFVDPVTPPPLGVCINTKDCEFAP